jgi:hypothetical protein
MSTNALHVMCVASMLVASHIFVVKSFQTRFGIDLEIF